ncbi:hypothetical protein ACWEQ0_12300 [Nocardia thailandica]
MHVEFGADRIRYTGYEIPAATVHPDGTLAAALIRDADWSTHPPEIRTRRGETLFVPAAHSQDLALFCERAAITRVRRFDVWADCSNRSSTPNSPKPTNARPWNGCARTPASTPPRWRASAHGSTGS